MSINHKKFHFQSHGTLFFGQHWQPREAKAVVVLVHGFGEHSGRYADFVVPELVKKNIAVVSYDNFGHGETEGKRGHCPNYDALMFVLGIVVRKAEDLFPGLPVFLYGHSMGGNLVLNYVLRSPHKVTGVIATSPYLRLAFDPPKWKMLVGKMLMGVSPGITLASGLEVEAISRDASEVAKYKEDPLVHDKVSPMFSFPIMDAGEWVVKKAEELSVPTLLLHGTDDRLIDHKASVELEAKAPMSKLHLFKGGYHELHNDLEKDKALKIVTTWIDDHVGANFVL
ncbi:alpha/beta hydrolase [Sungkyunkwania multivorans]|uniref:Alpha/beta hydrolase n=1 Tax=Sungkyunkwania multivorans TaxID=1173618 RepID=A0ABW3CUB4_9FLAO